MPPVYLYPYKETSEGAKQLARAIGIKRLKHEHSSFIGNSNKTVINWGAHELPDEVRKASVLNPTERLVPASNKLSFFQLMDVTNGPRIPGYTTNIDIVMGWLSDGFSVCQRAILNGHSGSGLSIVDRHHIDAIVIAPLYTKYIKKKDEYRVHFAFGNIIDIQRKALRTVDDNGEAINPSDVNFKIRNHSNGFIFVRNDVNPPVDVIDQAKKAFELTKLDFGAIDIIYNESQNSAYVLETNTAPGLCGQTVQSYANTFKEKLNV